MTSVKATISSKGQVTVPKAIRDALGLTTGSVIEFELADGTASIRPAGRGWMARFGSVQPRERPEDWAKVREATARAVGREAAEEGR